MYTQVIFVCAVCVMYKVSAESVGFTQFEQYSTDAHGKPSYFSYHYHQDVPTDHHHHRHHHTHIYRNPHYQQNSYHHHSNQGSYDSHHHHHHFNQASHGGYHHHLDHKQKQQNAFSEPLFVPNGKLLDASKAHKDVLKNVKLKSEGFVIGKPGSENSNGNSENSHHEEDLNVEDIQSIVEVVENIKNLREILPIKRRRNKLFIAKNSRSRLIRPLKLLMKQN